jgi:hypothetical protein
MYCLSVTLTSSEWLKIQQAAAKQFPNETLSRSELIRRFTLAGIEALGGMSEADRAQRARQYQQSMALAGDGERLRT